MVATGYVSSKFPPYTTAEQFDLYQRRRAQRIVSAASTAGWRAPTTCGVKTMKSIINGLRYDTANAILIGEAGYNGAKSDFQWWRAGLYRTPRSGRYFLAGEGGPMTRWSTFVDGGGRTYGSAIFPMTAEDAREFAERYLTTGEVEAWFGAQIEDA